MNQLRTRGRPGPAITFGLPLLLVGVSGYLGVRAFQHAQVNVHTGPSDSAHPPELPARRVSTPDGFARDARSGVATHPAGSAPSSAAAAPTTPARAGTLTLPGISFGHASYQLDAAAQATIAEVAERLSGFPAMCIRIIGYSTRREDPDPAHRLSRLRGLAVAQELSRLDAVAFPATRFDVRGLGADRTEDGKSVPGGAKARKTEFALFTCATK